MRAGCTLRYVGARDGVASALVLDVSGRQIRRLATVWRPAGTHSIPWDGRDASGNRVRPGTYFAKVLTDGRELVARITVTD
jgi:flagellar hook assembly protein FlgD